MPKKVLSPVVSASLALAVAAGAGAIALGSATAAPEATPAAQPSLSALGSVKTGDFAESASEIVAYDAKRKQGFVVNAQAGRVDVLDLSDPKAPVVVGSLDTPGANSVAVHGDLVAVAEQSDPKHTPGTVTFFDARTLKAITTVTVGALPDMLTFTENGSYVLVANEGEPQGYLAGQVDPEGSVSIIDVRKGAARATVSTADFRAFNDEVDALREQGIRIFGPGSSVAQDLEPEYIAVSTNGRTAYATLQENNAIAVIDIQSARVTTLIPLGLKDHSLAGTGLDASDRDGKINIATWPVKGIYMPDGIASFTSRGGEYLITANEGDAREYDGFEEEVRIGNKSVKLDPTVFPNAATLQNNANLGRLNMTTTSPKNAKGEYTQIQVFGGRSASIIDAATGERVWDSGDQFEQLIAEKYPAIFNANHEETGFDNRSDNKGPEPEGVAVGKIEGRTYAFVGLERVSGIAVIDVTDAKKAKLIDIVVNRQDDGPVGGQPTGDLGPEGLTFVSQADSPTKQPMLLVGNEVSGTTTAWQINLGR
ncbi:choice-of-anchor I family protein [Kribbia dieselivorans]|uniref:choice-of-anchor I family protein n=1 Tax=Kribbia dieselivorans TaxID=331526 RepID=UPI0008385A24|nr:choice-of-anchor I family protein [Kribbia dieselivorans]